MRCESCGQEWKGTYGDPCPACGTVAQNPFEQGPAPASNQGAPAAGGPSPWESPRTAPAGPEHAYGGGGIPWEEEQSAQSMFETVKAVLFEAQDTFATAGRDIGIGPAFTFALILGIAGGLIGNLWGLATSGLMTDMSGMEGLEGFVSGGVASFLMVPVLVVVQVFVGAGILHLCLMIVGAANAGFESTFRIVGYASGAAALFQVIPVVGALIGGIWAIVVEILAVKEMHDTTTGKAALAVLLPILVCCCCGVAAAVSAAGAFAPSSGF